MIVGGVASDRFVHRVCAVPLIEKQVALTGAYTWATVVPDPDRRLAFPVHAELLTKNGKSQFVYIFATTPVKGATGSAGAPIAVT